VHACVCESACTHAGVLDVEGSWVFVSTALTIVWNAVSLTGYSDYLTGFSKPLLPPYRCHTSSQYLAGEYSMFRYPSFSLTPWVTLS